MYVYLLVSLPLLNQKFSQGKNKRSTVTDCRNDWRRCKGHWRCWSNNGCWCRHYNNLYINYLRLSRCKTCTCLRSRSILFHVSTSDVDLVDLNHFSRAATTRCTVKYFSSFFLLSLPSSTRTCHENNGTQRARVRVRERMSSERLSRHAFSYLLFLVAQWWVRLYFSGRCGSC